MCGLCASRGANCEVFASTALPLAPSTASAFSSQRIDACYDFLSAGHLTTAKFRLLSALKPAVRTPLATHERVASLDCAHVPTAFTGRKTEMV